MWEEIESMLDLSRKGIADIISLQKAAILTADRAAPADFASLTAAFGMR
jgi:hypothetical protein